MAGRGGFWQAAFDRDVLRLAGLGYALPAISGVASTVVTLGVLSQVWPLLFAPAVGLHALLALNVANRISDPRDDAPGIPDAPDLAQTQARLEQGFKEVGSAEGLDAAQELAREYAQLGPVVARRRITDSLALGQVPLLAEETYRLGLSVLDDALHLLAAVSPGDLQRLESENAALRQDVEYLASAEGQEARLRIKQSMLESNQELLALMSKQQTRVDELLFQADRCSASLQRTRMELAALRADGASGSVDSVLDTLKLTISHARGVQDEMKRLSR